MAEIKPKIEKSTPSTEHPYSKTKVRLEPKPGIDRSL